MLPIQHAARALGVPDDQIRRLAMQGTIPGAVDRSGEWLIPTMSLVTIARQQGWTLDLAALQHQLDEHALSRYSGDALAAQAAVLLAKTQATAARVESRDLLRRLREAMSAAEADRAARAEAAETLADVQRELEEARRNQAVAEARLTEMRNRLSSDDQQFQFMADRIKNLEQERHRLSRSLGWFGRLRYRRLAERELSRPSTQAERSAARHDAPVIADEPAPEPKPEHETRSSDETPTSIEPPAPERPVVDLPVREVATEENDSPKTALGQWPVSTMAHPPPRVSMTVPPVPITNTSTVIDQPAAADRRPGDPDETDDRDRAHPDDRPRRRYTQVPRTADGRFDRSALARARSAKPLPTR